MVTEHGSSLWSLHSARLWIAFMLSVALCIEGLMRSNLNMAMVCMVNRTAVRNLEDSIKTTLSTQNLTTLPDIKNETCSYQRTITSKQNKSYHGELVWTSQQQAWIFAAYYAGTLLIVMPGSYFIDQCGATMVVLIGALTNVIGSFLTPIVSRTVGAYALMFLRFLMGCGQGVLVPATSVLIAAWFPEFEKSTAVAIATSGNQFSIIFAMIFTAELCQVPFLDGWPLAFYIHGFFGLILCILWAYYVKDVPTRYKKITDTELAHIVGNSNGRGQKRKVAEPPWRKILGSTAVWATAASSFSQSFVTVGTITYLPLYYGTVLNMDLSSNGLLSAMPFLCQLVTKVLFAGLADRAKSGGFSVNSVTKFCNLSASIGSAACYVLLMLLDCSHRWIAVTAVCFAIGITSGFIPGYNTSIVCLAPKYTSSVASFCRLWASIASVAAPYIIGIITKRSVLSEWRLAFCLMVFILLLAGVFFQISGSAVPEDWAQDQTCLKNLAKRDSEGLLDNTTTEKKDRQESIRD
ncbi:hypothetical protein AB6A40_002723 [Gnathostoma spinigerum]|uniref:Major facilitator superfamily (MFS) profile domain-containing protein n=1 Tax=Gnathostoma spinigerum TaxID=75299 RepID=A0ABD6ECY4_9BILA